MKRGIRVSKVQPASPAVGSRHAATKRLARPAAGTATGRKPIGRTVLHQSYGCRTSRRDSRHWLCGAGLFHAPVGSTAHTCSLGAAHLRAGAPRRPSTSRRLSARAGQPRSAGALRGAMRPPRPPTWTAGTCRTGRLGRRHLPTHCYVGRGGGFQDLSRPGSRMAPTTQAVAVERVICAVYPGLWSINRSPRRSRGGLGFALTKAAP